MRRHAVYTNDYDYQLFHIDFLSVTFVQVPRSATWHLANLKLSNESCFEPVSPVAKSIISRVGAVPLFPLF
jgi:hypothetical protein